MQYIDKYNLAFSFKEDEKYEEAIKIFKDLLKSNNNTISKENIVFQIGGCHYFNKNYNEALSYFLKTQKLNDSDESTSLGIYLSLIGLGKTEEAIKELSRFSDKYPISLYRDTIKELMEDISQGVGTDFMKIAYTIKNKYEIQE